MRQEAVMSNSYNDACHEKTDLKGYMTPMRFWCQWVADPPRKNLWKFEGATTIHCWEICNNSAEGGQGGTLPVACQKRRGFQEWLHWSRHQRHVTADASIYPRNWLDWPNCTPKQLLISPQWMLRIVSNFQRILLKSWAIQRYQIWKSVIYPLRSLSLSY